MGALVCVSTLSNIMHHIYYYYVHVHY